MRWCLLLFVAALLACCKDSRKVCDGCLHEIYVPLLEDDITEYPIVSKLFGSIDTIYLENVGPRAISQLLMRSNSMKTRSLSVQVQPCTFLTVTASS